jgi:hypothetical protein
MQLPLTEFVTAGQGIWPYLRRADRRFTTKPRCVIDLLPRPLWAWLDRRTPPAPPQLGADDLDLSVSVYNWAVAQTRVSAPHSPFPWRPA